MGASKQAGTSPKLKRERQRTIAKQLPASSVTDGQASDLPAPRVPDGPDSRAVSSTRPSAPSTAREFFADPIVDDVDIDEADKYLLIGASRTIKELRHSIKLAARSNFPVLIQGERGSGRSNAARLLHFCSPRRNDRFVVANLATIVPQLAAAELCGSMRGAFTGAADSPGIIWGATGGSLVLDRLDESSDDVLRYLLPLAENSTIRPLGSTRDRVVDVRIIGIITGEQPGTQPSVMCQELISHIGNVVIKVPALRDHIEDLPDIVQHIIRSRVTDAPVLPQIEQNALDLMMSYHFPGNVRELYSIIINALVFAKNGLITRSQIEPQLRRRDHRHDTATEIATLRSQLTMTETELRDIRNNSVKAHPIWQGRNFPVESGYCFVLMPFNESNDIQTIYRNHILPTVQKCGLRCERADDIYNVSGVMQSVWEGINRASLIIADLTDRNSNVFYELGIAHTLGKPVAMITQSMDCVPFDLRHLRCIVYRYKPVDIERFEQALVRTIRTILSALS